MYCHAWHLASCVFWTWDLFQIPHLWEIGCYLIHIVLEIRVSLKLGLWTRYSLSLVIFYMHVSHCSLAQHALEEVSPRMGYDHTWGCESYLIYDLFCGNLESSKGWDIDLYKEVLFEGVDWWGRGTWRWRPFFFFNKKRPFSDVCFSYPCWSEDEVAILERRCGAL